MQYFLIKADPDTDYSIDDLQRDGSTPWEGVHNAQAILNIRTMKTGDRVYVYHSQKQKAIVGLGEVASDPYPVTHDPRPSWAVKVQFVKKFDTPVSLADIKQAPELADFLLVRNSRLSVMPVPSHVVDWLGQRGAK